MFLYAYGCRFPAGSVRVAAKIQPFSARIQSMEGREPALIFFVHPGVPCAGSATLNLGFDFNAIFSQIFQLHAESDTDFFLCSWRSLFLIFRYFSPYFSCFRSGFCTERLRRWFCSERLRSGSIMDLAEERSDLGIQANYLVYSSFYRFFFDDWISFHYKYNMDLQEFDMGNKIENPFLFLSVLRLPFHSRRGGHGRGRRGSSA